MSTTEAILLLGGLAVVAYIAVCVALSPAKHQSPVAGQEVLDIDPGIAQDERSGE